MFSKDVTQFIDYILVYLSVLLLSFFSLSLRVYVPSFFERCSGVDSMSHQKNHHVAFPEFYESALIGCLKIGIVRINSDTILSRVPSLTTANHRIADHNSAYGLTISHIKRCYLNRCYMHIEIQNPDFSHLVVQIFDEFAVTNILFPRQ